MPRKETKFKYPINPCDSFMLGVSKNIDYYKGQDLMEIVGLFSRTFSREQPFAAAPKAQTSFSSGKEPARILLYADSLNAFNRMIYHCMYPSDPISHEQARQEEEQEATSWFDGQEGQALRGAISWTHILRWRDIEQHASFPAALDRVRNLYKSRDDRPISLKQCGEDKTLIAQFSFSEKIDSLVDKRVSANYQKIQEWNTLHQDRQIYFNIAEAVRLNREYLFYECAGEFVIVAIVEESGKYFVPQHVLYPGKINEAIGFIHEMIQGEYYDSKRTVMQVNPINIRRLEEPKLKGVVSRSPASPIAESSPSSTSPPCSCATQLVMQGIFTSKAKEQEISAEQLGLLFVDISKCMVQLNGKFSQFQKLIWEANTVIASGNPLPPEIRFGLMQVNKYMEKLRGCGEMPELAPPLNAGQVLK